MVIGVQPTGQTADAQLVQRARSGDEQACDLLFRRHYPKVYNLALHLEGNRDDAADVAQTAFVRAYDSLHRLRDEQAFLKWVYRIVVNIVRDRTKAARRKPWISFQNLLRPSRNAEESAEPVEFADRSLDPERIAMRKARGHALQNAIAALPLEFREALTLHHLQNLDVKQIAEVLGIPEGTVKSRLGRARQRLREALREWLDEE
jgi:RNA polymerase sigma-70 factor (ECF subfamily)